MTEYYFLVSLLPALEIGHIPALGFSALKDLLDTNLSDRDKQKVEKFLALIDIENMRSFWAKEPLDTKGRIEEEQMEETLDKRRWPSGEEFPPYLQDYLETYTTTESRLHHFPQLLSQFFQHTIEEEKGFIREFFQFQREMRLVLVGFRAHRWNRDLAAELQYEDPKDPIVAQILAQKDAKVYEPPFEYRELKSIFEEYADSPAELHKAIYAYQFKQIVERWGSDVFSLDRILNYMARLLLVERWLALDTQKGIHIIDTIEKEIP